MTMEIKVGDKVRVSKDAPKLYTRYATMVCGVNNVEDGIAVISPTDKPMVKCVIPLKYLVKVEDEAKEPKFKVGDVVRIKPDAYKLHQGYQNGYAWLPERDNYLGRVASVKEIWCDGSIILSIGSNLMWGPIDLEPYTEPTTPTIKVGDRVRNIESGLIGVVDNIVYRDVAWVYCMDGNRYNWKFYELELVQPTEQTEKKPNIGSITIPVEVDLTDSYWDAYTADLAHDIALKVANKFNIPEQAADYAVSVAKAVVENLKKK